MTPTATTPHDAAIAACRTWGLRTDDLAPVRAHATSVFVAPHDEAIVRISSIDQHDALDRSVRLTRWLTSQGLDVTQPLDVPQPLDTHGHTATLWRRYPQPEGPPPGPEHLGRLLRELHQLPAPPLTLPPHRPHMALQHTIKNSVALSPADRDWLLSRSQYLLAQHDALDFPLGHGLIHGDAYPGNTLWDGARARLGDWDEAAVGPREIDLANTFQGIRFGRTKEQLHAFSRAYGYDVAGWPGLPVLIELRDLHTLGSYIQRADRGDDDATTQLAFRLATLKNDEPSARWAAS